MNHLDFDICYQAIQNKDASYVGSFFVAVKTTGIFCRPGCPARLPKPENVDFYHSAAECLKHGYRPCKKCKPLSLPGETPPEIAALLLELEKTPDTPLRDQDLRDRGLQPEAVRRWFNKHHNMTFHAYQRLLRLNRSYEGLVNGQSVTEAAFASGYESLSGFNTRFKDVWAPCPAPLIKPLPRLCLNGLPRRWGR